MSMAKLLVIEDQEAELDLIKRKLEGRFDLRTARTLGEASDVIGSETLDAVLLDLGLPDTEKDMTMRACKRICPPIAIIVLSGNADPDVIKRTISENASEYLVKGIGDSTGEALATSIRTAIKNNAAICAIKSMKE